MRSLTLYAIMQENLANLTHPFRAVWPCCGVVLLLLGRSAVVRHFLIGAELCIGTLSILGI